MSRRTSAKSLRRTAGTTPTHRPVVVYTEGITEAEYVHALTTLPHLPQGTRLRIEIDGERGLDPRAMVHRARRHPGYPEVDECWCFFDVEWPQHHPNQDEAKALAKETPEIHLAISNPCFEIWLALHYKYYSSFLDTVTAERLSETLDGHSGKHIDAGAYMPLLPAAVRHAERLDQWHRDNGTSPPNDNPSSGVHRFVRAIGGLPTP